MSELKIIERDGAIIAVPDKRLDTNTAPDAETGLALQLEKGNSKIIIDFKNTDYISSAGLRVILKSAKMAKQNSGLVVLCNANSQIHEVLEISGFLTMLKHFDNLDDALQHVLGN
ncbi:STAS domain-containing protein [bacterium]|nr:STAS domain-containing protein [bacterium]